MDQRIALMDVSKERSPTTIASTFLIYEVV